MIEQGNSEPATDNHAHPDTRDGIRQALQRLVDQARNELIVVAPMLDPAVWNSQSMAGSLSRLATGHSRNRIRFVIEDSEYFLLACTRLVELTRRLSDIVSIRRIGDTHRGFNEILAIADQSSCFVQRDAGQMNATLDLRAPRLTAPHLDRTQEIWERSDPVPGLHPFRV